MLEQEVELNKQKQQPRRHRLHAPRGRKKQTSLYKSLVWHVIYDYMIHQRTDSEIHSHHRDVYFIPPPRGGGGAVGASTPVSTVPLGLFHHVDPLSTQLREDPASLAVRNTRLRVLSTMRLVRTGLVGQLAALQQWEEAMHSQGGQ